jgi:hypothetical protein
MIRTMRLFRKARLRYRLGATDVPQMLALVELTQPGPFARVRSNAGGTLTERAGDSRQRPVNGWIDHCRS